MSLHVLSSLRWEDINDMELEEAWVWEGFDGAVPGLNKPWGIEKGETISMVSKSSDFLLGFIWFYVCFTQESCWTAQWKFPRTGTISVFSLSIGMILFSPEISCLQKPDLKQILFCFHWKKWCFFNPTVLPLSYPVGAQRGRHRPGTWAPLPGHRCRGGVGRSEAVEFLKGRREVKKSTRKTSPSFGFQIQKYLMALPKLRENRWCWIWDWEKHIYRFYPFLSWGLNGCLCNFGLLWQNNFQSMQMFGASAQV